MKTMKVEKKMQTNVTDTIRQEAESIQQNALNPENSNCVSRELTYQQSLSIALRSESLKSPSKQLAYEISTCYKQRDWE